MCDCLVLNVRRFVLRGRCGREEALRSTILNLNTVLLVSMKAWRWQDVRAESEPCRFSNLT